MTPMQEYTVRVYVTRTEWYQNGKLHRLDGPAIEYVNGEKEHTVAEGDGPVNALDAALRKALLPHYPQLKDIELVDYKVRVLNGKDGTAAKVRVLIETIDKKNNERWGTVGVSENIIKASWEALIDSIEFYLHKKV